MKKKIYMIIATLAIMLIMATCLVACENHGFNVEETNLVCIGASGTSSGWCALYYDKSTKVMYMLVKKQGYGSGLTPLYNADGTLKLYEVE